MAIAIRSIKKTKETESVKQEDLGKAEMPAKKEAVIETASKLTRSLERAGQKALFKASKALNLPLLAPKETQSLAKLPEGYFYARLTSNMLTESVMKSHDHESIVMEKIINWTRQNIIQKFINKPGGVGVAVVQISPNEFIGKEGVVKSLLEGTIGPRQLGNCLQSGQVKVAGIMYGMTETGDSKSPDATYSTVNFTSSASEFFQRRARGDSATLVLNAGDTRIGDKRDVFLRAETTLVLDEYRCGGFGKALRGAGCLQLEKMKKAGGQTIFYSENSAYAIETMFGALSDGRILRAIESYQEVTEDKNFLNHFYLIFSKDASATPKPSPSENAAAILKTERFAQSLEEELNARLQVQAINRKDYDVELATIRRGLLLPPQMIAAAKEIGLLPSSFEYGTYGKQNAQSLAATESRSLEKYMSKRRTKLAA